MKRNIFKYVALGCLSVIALACNDSVSDQLESKIYFENRENVIEVPDEVATMEFDLTARLSSMTSSEVDVTYTIADQSVVDAYNARFGTNYEMFNADNVTLSATSSSITAGNVYANSVVLGLTGLDVLTEGKPFVLPIKVQSASMPTIEATSIAYYFITKPLKIKKVGNFNSGWSGGCIDLRADPEKSLGFPLGTVLDSWTYEALVYIDNFGGNMTIMGSEGVMIWRIGDQPGGVTPANQMEVAGQMAYGIKEGLTNKQWYHFALTYDKASGKSKMFINGEMKASFDSSAGSFEPNKDVGFMIGKINGFPWGERPMNGKMAEIRVWSVARTENQIRQNMMTVDPASDGLEVYFKLNGTETIEGGVIQDTTGKMKGKISGVSVITLDTPVEIK